MPRYRVTVEGQDYTVEIPDVTERPVRAIVDGEVIEVAIQRSGGSDELSVEQPAPKSAEPTAAPVRTPTLEPKESRSPRGNGAGTVTAPLPGTIVSVSVSPGERVDEGQELCILEAMKMNNPIRSTYAGVVEDVLVSPGQQVDHGAPLVVLSEA